MPWLYFLNCNCNCSKYPERKGILVNKQETNTIQGNVKTPENDENTNQQDQQPQALQDTDNTDITNDRSMFTEVMALKGCSFHDHFQEAIRFFKREKLHKNDVFYLPNSNQRCLVNGFLSSSRQIECGVPQGSILGPLLFLLYINDLPNCLDHTIPCLYADDTQIYASSQNPEELTSFINSDLERIQDWLAVNKLNMEIKHNRTKIGEQCPSWNHIYGRNGIEIKKIKYAINVFSIWRSESYFVVKSFGFIIMSCYSSICLAACVRFVSGFFALIQHLFLNEAKKGNF